MTGGGGAGGAKWAAPDLGPSFAAKAAALSG
jgi:hypothetical protein